MFITLPYFIFLFIGTTVRAISGNGDVSNTSSVEKKYCHPYHYRSPEIYSIDGVSTSPYAELYESFYIHVTCLDGFKLVGNKVGHCVNGEYVTPHGRCYVIDENNGASAGSALNISLCELPDHPKHGSYQIRHGRAHPETPHLYFEFDLTIKCNQGYELQGTSYMSCQNGKLINDVPTCVSKYGYLADLLETGTKRNLAYCKPPDIPKHGTYMIQGEKHPTIPNAYTKFYIDITCSDGYQVYGEESVSCNGGKWSSEMPLCGLPCRVKKHSKVEYQCETKRGLSICNDYVRPGEIVTPKCLDNITRDDLTVMRCNDNGYFDHIITCATEETPVECGLVTVSDGLIIGGFKVEKGEVPWHAAIYTKNTNPYMQICGGTIVTSTSVISAAHCFWVDSTNTKPPSNYAVAVGKIYRPWKDPQDIYAQKLEVMAIKIPILYFGSSANYQNDIAVVKLETAIEFNRFVRPICMDFSEENERNLDDGLRKVAGWGLKSVEGDSSPILKAVFLPIVDLDKCVNESPLAFQPYITQDKICAGYTNGTAVCKGDSGGGLTYHRVENGVYKHYLEGVVSTAPNYGLQQCNAFTWATFTSITKHKGFIYKNIK